MGVAVTERVDVGALLLVLVGSVAAGQAAWLVIDAVAWTVAKAVWPW